MAFADKKTGKAISRVQHIKNCVQTALSTRVGTRLRRRFYGSRIPSRVDAPLNADLILLLYGDIADTIFAYEPRLLPMKVQVNSVEWRKGRVVVDVLGRVLPEGRDLTLTDLVVLDKKVVS